MNTAPTIAIGYKPWLKCHGCGTEYALSQKMKGCGNLSCLHPDMHLHNDDNGDRPIDEHVRIMSVRWV